MKCLPQSKIPLAEGRVLHDTHAEILALRGFNHYILSSCLRILNRRNRHKVRSQEGEGGVRRTRADVCKKTTEGIMDDQDQDDDDHGEILTVGPRPSGNDNKKNAWAPIFRLKEDISLHMYTSDCPCGDASMELVMAAQEDATPWPVSTPAPVQLSLGAPYSSCIPESPGAKNNNGPYLPSDSHPPPKQVQKLPPAPHDLPGRSNFSLLSIVRRKPSRGDAPPTMSKSCTDKLSQKQCVSILSSLTSLFVRPEGMYLASLVMPAEQHGVCATSGCKRAFDARMAVVGEAVWRGGRRRTGRDGIEDVVDDDAATISTGDSATRAEKGAAFGNGKETAGHGTPSGVEDYPASHPDHRYCSDPDADADQGADSPTYTFHPLPCRPTTLTFPFSKSSLVSSSSSSSSQPPNPASPSAILSTRQKNSLAPSPLCILWTPALPPYTSEESLIGGVLQGRKFGEPKGMSVACRRCMWRLARHVAAALVDITGEREPGTEEVRALLWSSSKTYRDVKESCFLETRRTVLRDVREGCLRGWVRNLGDEGFRLDGDDG